VDPAAGLVALSPIPPMTTSGSLALAGRPSTSRWVRDASSPQTMQIADSITTSAIARGRAWDRRPAEEVAVEPVDDDHPVPVGESLADVDQPGVEELALLDRDHIGSGLGHDRLDAARVRYRPRRERDAEPAPDRLGLGPVVERGTDEDDLPPGDPGARSGSARRSCPRTSGR
jgi:hypothetical protein